ncbi:MAG: CotH kinase family protein [Acidobacteriota bacterium]|jgi:hypothetical protein|nr:CotH kinase family protein [Acidobacteriota bacterium]
MRRSAVTLLLAMFSFSFGFHAPARQAHAADERPDGHLPGYAVTDAAEDAAEPLSVGQYVQVGKRQVTRTVYEYTYTSVASNGGPAVRNVVATLTSTDPNTIVVEGTVRFGNVAAYGTKFSGSDTFTISQDRLAPFDPASLHWEIAFEAEAHPAPTAKAGADQSVTLGETVTLDGSASLGYNGGTLSYLWEWKSKPAGSAAAFSDPAAALTTFVADKPGAYVVTLVCSDDYGAGLPDEVTVSTEVVKPEADAGEDRGATVGETVTLDGGASTDPNGLTLEYAWVFVARPEGSAATLSSPSAVRPSFTVDKPGDYRLALVVSNGYLDSDPSYVVVSTGALPPVARAGEDRHVAVGETGTLDGNASLGYSGGALSYRWEMTSKPAGSEASLHGADTAAPWFRADLMGDYVIELVVSDGEDVSGPDTVLVSTYVVKPEADAGVGGTATVGETVTLDGGASSDPQDYPLSYTWTLLSTTPGGISVTLSGAATSRPTFTPAVAGTYVFQLVVNNGVYASAPATVVIEASARPLASTGDYSIPASTVGAPIAPVDVAGGVSGGTAPYSFAASGLPAGITVSATGVVSGTPTTAQAAGTATVTVTDSSSPTQTAYITISYGAVTAAVGGNQPPVAKLAMTVPNVHELAERKANGVGGWDFVMYLDGYSGATVAVELSAASSEDEDVSTLQYAWTVTPSTGAPVTLTGREVTYPYQVAVGKSFDVELVVTDAGGLTGTAVSNRNRIGHYAGTGFTMSDGARESAPNDSTLSLTVAPGETVPVHVTAKSCQSFFDGCNLTWLLDGSYAGMGNYFVKSLGAGTYPVELRVSDRLVNGGSSAEYRAATGWIVVTESSPPAGVAEMVDFRIGGISGVIDQDEGTIVLATQDWIEDIDALAAEFTAGGAVTVEGVAQVSGATKNDFRKDVTYVVEAAGGARRTYAVRIQSPQTTGLPVIKIDTKDNAAIVSKETYVKTNIAVFDTDHPEYELVHTAYADEVRGRGNTTWMYPKKPYRIKFAEKTPLFGLTKAKSWVLLANYQDPTFMMNSVAFEMGRRFGLPFTNHYVHVELFLNGDYQGSYVLTEQVQVGKGRVDIDEDDGFLVELDFHYDEEPRFRSDKYNLPVMIKSPEDLTDPSGYDFVKDAVNGLETAMYDASFPESGYRELIDMDTFVDFLLINEIVKNGELYNPGSTYMYKDAGGKIGMGPLWDFDCGFGQYYQEYFSAGSYKSAIAPQDVHPFFKRFFEDRVFVAKYKDRWVEMREQVGEMPDFIDSLAAAIHKSAEENSLRWKDLKWGDAEHDSSVAAMKVWWQERMKYLDKYIGSL